LRLRGADGLAAALLGEASRSGETSLEDALERTLATADRRSSGPFSLSELARRDHPYAQRHPRPLLEPSMVNEQTGAFRRMCEKRRLSRLHGQVVNDSPVAKFFEGTETMVERPIGEAVEAETVARSRGRLERS
jgi:hypothetical protein